MLNTLTATSSTLPTVPVAPTTVEPATVQSQNAQCCPTPSRSDSSTVSTIPDGTTSKAPHDCFGTILSQIGDFISQVWDSIRQPSPSAPALGSPAPTNGTTPATTPSTMGTSSTTPSTPTTPLGTSSAINDDGIKSLMEKFSLLLDSLMDRIAALEQKVTTKKGAKKKKAPVAT